jgi:ubiquinone biosynthesis protein
MESKLMIWHMLKLMVLACRCGMAKSLSGQIRQRWVLSGLFRIIDLGFSYQRARYLAQLPDRLHRLGAGYVKLGQMLATREDVIGAVMASRLSCLHDNVMPPCPTRMKPWLNRISEQTGLIFTPDPIAAGSVAVVYKARLSDGTCLAVKLLRPDIKAELIHNLRLIKQIYRFAQWLFPQQQIIQLDQVLGQFGHIIDQECDLRIEADHMARFAHSISSQPNMISPVVYWSYTTRDMLTMSYHDGYQITDITHLKQYGHEPARLVETLTQLYFQHIFIDGWFHGDPHPGNILIDPEGRMVFLDFGLTGQLDHAARRFLLSVMIAIKHRQTALLIRLHKRAGMIPDSTNMTALTAAIDQVFIHGASDDKSNDIFRQIKAVFHIANRFGIRVAPSWPVLHKTLIMLDGLIKKMAPDGYSEKTIADWFTDYLLRDMNAAFVPLSLVPAFIEWDQSTDHVLLNMWKNSNFQQNKAA